jgi:DNA-binding NarL/FixJ family response regulator
MGHKHILIVDDSEIVRKATRHLLEDETEYEVCGEAVDGVDALEKARHLSPDLIILDLQMPRMNGLQTARELRAMRVSAPIILFTMYADAVRPDDALAAGVSAVVAKTNLPALRQHVENLLMASYDSHA